MAYDTTYCRRIVDENNKLIRQWKAQNNTILYEDPFYIPFYIHNRGTSACTITVHKGTSNLQNNNLYYSTNGRSSWSTLTLSSNNTNYTFSIPAGRTCFLRAAFAGISSTYVQFNGATQNIDLGGNMLSLVANNNYTSYTTQQSLSNLTTSTFTTQVKNVARLALPYCTVSNFLGGGTFTDSPILYATTCLQASSSNAWTSVVRIVCTGHFQCYGNSTSNSFYVSSSAGTIYCPTNVTFTKNSVTGRFTSQYSARWSEALMPSNWSYSQKSILNVTS